jgi:transcriptional regulator with XRE-family HTH domain
MKTAEKISERLRFKDDFEKIEFLADSIQLDILHQLTDNTNIRKTDIAKKMRVSNSFISQLFSGDKRLSLNHLVTLIYHYDLDFKFELKPNDKGKIIRFSDYLNKSKDTNCIFGDDVTKYHANKYKEEENRKTCSV